MTLPYPPGGITDVEAWRWEIAAQAFRDGQLTRRQVAEFVSCTPYEVVVEFERRGIEMLYDRGDWEEDVKVSEELIAEQKLQRVDRH